MDDTTNIPKYPNPHSFLAYTLIKEPVLFHSDCLVIGSFNISADQTSGIVLLKLKSLMDKINELNSLLNNVFTQ